MEGGNGEGRGLTEDGLNKQTALQAPGLFLVKAARSGSMA